MLVRCICVVWGVKDALRCYVSRYWVRYIKSGQKGSRFSEKKRIQSNLIYSIANLPWCATQKSNYFSKSNPYSVSFHDRTLHLVSKDSVWTELYLTFINKKQIKAMFAQRSTLAHRRKLWPCELTPGNSVTTTGRDVTIGSRIPILL